MLQRGLHGGKGLKIIDVIAIKRYNLNIIMLYHLWRFIMQIKPSAAIRQNYNEIADMCRKSAEPFFYGQNGILQNCKKSQGTFIVKCKCIDVGA